MDILDTKFVKDDYVDNFLLEINPPAKDKDTKSWYLKIKETMTRIGIPHYNSPNRPKLFQSMYILKRGGRYYLPMFKEMFILDGQQTKMNVDDILRRNSIACMLHDWGMIKLTEKSFKSIKALTTNALSIKTRPSIFILPFNKKRNWSLIQKYPIGVIKNLRYHKRTI